VQMELLFDLSQHGILYLTNIRQQHHILSEPIKERGSRNMKCTNSVSPKEMSLENSFKSYM